MVLLRGMAESVRWDVDHIDRWEIGLNVDGRLRSKQVGGVNTKCINSITIQPAAAFASGYGYPQLPFVWLSY